VRNLEISSGKTDDAAAQDSEAFDSGGFLAGFEKELVAEANAKVGLARGGPLANGFPQTGGTEIFGTMGKSSDAGNDDGVEAGHLSG
jgi:hypothetical protein